ncbi:MAG: signal recognition particle receptor subunit alpha, partial [Sedimenticolaceae bacterium]
MFGFGKKKQNEPSAEQDTAQPGFFERLKQGLARSRSTFSDGLADLVLGKKKIDDDLLEELETLLLTADVGVDTTQRIIDDLTDRVKRKTL